MRIRRALNFREPPRGRTLYFMERHRYFKLSLFYRRYSRSNAQRHGFSSCQFRSLCLLAEVNCVFVTFVFFLLVKTDIKDRYKGYEGKEGKERKRKGWIQGVDFLCSLFITARKNYLTWSHEYVRI